VPLALLRAVHALFVQALIGLAAQGCLHLYSVPCFVAGFALRACVRACVRACSCACMRDACVRACVRICVHLCVSACLQAYMHTRDDVFQIHYHFPKLKLSLLPSHVGRTQTWSSDERCGTKPPYVLFCSATCVGVHGWRDKYFRRYVCGLTTHYFVV